MAQPGDFPINPMVPTDGVVTVPVPMTLNGKSTTCKRRREEEPMTGEATVSESKRQAKSQDVLFRIVIPSRQIGKVIGKEGCRIRKIREETKATVKIADAIVRHEERVIIISSKDDDSVVSDAEKALQKIATLILKEDDSNVEAVKVGAVHVAANSIRLLIAGSQAGSLIGMSGQNIEKLRNSSGATITILAPSQLPFCASALESDRVVQISGDAPSVLQALENVSYQLRENPPRQVISISPAYNYNAFELLQPYPDPTSADYITFEMSIPKKLAGVLIGKCGTTMKTIEFTSGAMIKVYGGKGEQEDIQIQFGGSAQQVALAKQMVDEHISSQEDIYSRLPREVGTEQSKKIRFPTKHFHT